MVLKSRLRAPDWGANGDPDREAKCRKHPLPTNHDVNALTDPWFYDEPEATHICNGTYDGYVCPFRQVCLHIALVNNEQSGTFGGMTTEQRRWVRRISKYPGPPRAANYFDRDHWDSSDTWRHLVPPPDWFDNEDADDDQED